MENSTNITLPKVVAKRAKRVGRGYGSGKGAHTAGRGQKGQKVRNKVGILFEGYKVKKSLIRRLPQLRGKGKFKAQAARVVVTLTQLEKLPAGTVVDIETLIKHEIVDAKEAKARGVKILGVGKLTKKLQTTLPMSKSAANSFDNEPKARKVVKKN